MSMYFARAVGVALALTGVRGALAAVAYSEYILAPSDRTVYPVSVYQTSGTVTNAEGLTTSGSGSVTLAADSYVTYDFGKNITCAISVTARDSSDSSAQVALVFA